MEEKKLVVAQHKFRNLVESVNKNEAKNLRGWKRLSKKPLFFKKQKQEEQISRFKRQLADFSRQIEDLKIRIEDYKRRMADTGTYISGTQRNLAEAEAGLESLNKLLRSRNKETKEKWVSDFGKLRGFSLVKAVKVWNGVIMVYTDTIYITWYRRKYEIGNFLIKIDTKKSSASDAIGIENLCNTSDCGRHHPYTSDEYGEDFCFGNMGDELEDLFEEGDFLTMIEVILKAFQTAKGDSTYLIKKWKRVEK